MNQPRNRFQLALLVILIGLLGWVYGKSAQVDVDQHIRVLQMFGQLRQHSSTLDKFILQSRQDQLLNYDPIVATQQRISLILVDLEHVAPQYFVGESGETQTVFLKFKEMNQAKAGLVESFKSHRSVLRNSLSYIPIAINELLQTPEGRSQSELLHALLDDVLLYDHKSDSIYLVDMTRGLETLMRSPLNKKVEADNLTRHIAIVRKHKTEVDEYVSDITRMPMAAQIDLLFDTYSQAYKRQEVEASWYKDILTLLAAVLILYTAWMFLGLQRAKQSLSKSLRELEFQKFALDQHSIVSITDATGRIIYSNDKFSEVSQYPRNDLLGKDHRLLNSGFHPRSFFQDMWRTIAQGNVWHGVVRNRKRDGSYYWVDSTIVPFKDEQGKVEQYVSIRTDISAIKEAEAAILNAKNAAEEASRTKSDFLANMSHEIRTPMNGIIGMTELALDTPLTHDQREYLSLVRSSANALMHIINDLLDFSKIESGKMEIEHIEFSIDRLMREMMKSLAVRAHQKQLELLLHIESGVPEMLIGDPNRLRQVLINLVGNAIKFTDTGEIEVSIAALECGTAGQARLVFSVRDSGIGIPEDKFQTIFESFSQADSSTSRKYGGTGLGLAISSQLVNLMGGKIQVSSEIGKGSTFGFELVLPARSSDVYQEISAEALQGLTVLVVDDNESSRRHLTEMLENWKMCPTTVDNGIGAINEITHANAEGRPFRLVLLDAMMPGGDTFELAEAIRSLKVGELDIIMMLTSSEQRERIQRCKTSKRGGCVMKPLAPSELLDAMMNILGFVKSGTQGASVAQPARKLAQRGLNLLVAEDNTVNQKLATRILEKAGHQVTIAVNGREAVKMWRAGSFDAILMDVDMPEQNGYEATEEIRRQEVGHGAHIPVIAMTAHAMQGAREKCLSHGMDDHLTKPIDAITLIERLDALSMENPSRNEANIASESDTTLQVADFGKARQTMDDNRDLFVEICGMVREDIPKYLDKLRVGAQSGDAEAIRYNAHTLKGMISIFAAEKAMSEAYRLERDPGDDPTTAIRRLGGALEEFLIALDSYEW